MMYPYYFGGGYGLGPGLFGGIFMLIFWVIIIWAIIALICGVRRGGCGWHDHGEHRTEESPKPVRSGNSALDILNERYAKGEINKEEYEQKKKDILG